MNRYTLPRFSTLRVAAVILGLGLVGCEARNPFDIGWTESPDTVLLYSLARPELNLPSAFEFHRRVAHIVQAPSATGAWDLLLDSEADRLVLVLPEVFGITSEARIIELPGMAFEEVAEAPSDTTGYTKDEVVGVRLGSVYVIRTHRGSDRFGFNCVFYAKMEAVEIDVPRGTLRFVFDSNPLCNDRDLIAPDRG